MTDTQVQEGNKLIAEFIGAYRPHNEQNPYEKTFLYKDGERWMQLEALKYHISWDWLMPVVEKINGTYEATQLMAYGLNQLRITAKIEAVWQAVVDFIKLYNQTK